MKYVQANVGKMEGPRLNRSITVRPEKEPTKNVPPTTTTSSSSIVTPTSDSSDLLMKDRGGGGGGPQIVPAPQVIRRVSRQEEVKDDIYKIIRI